MDYTIQELAEMYFEEFGSRKLDDEWAGTAYLEYVDMDIVEYADFAEQMRQALAAIPA